jgi:hypothetical protein
MFSLPQFFIIIAAKPVSKTVTPFFVEQSFGHSFGDQTTSQAKAPLQIPERILPH